MMKQVGGESSPPFIFIKKDFGLIMQYVNITYVRFNYHKNLGNNQDFIIQKKGNRGYYQIFKLHIMSCTQKRVPTYTCRTIIHQGGAQCINR